MSEVIKEERVHSASSDAARRSGLCSVLLYYAIACHGDNGLKLLHVPLGFGEEALLLFSSWQLAQNFFLSDVFDGEWYVRECSAGELTSLLLGPYKGIDWVLLDPLAGYLKTGGAQANLTSRERFVEHLLGSQCQGA
jgi:hypothetical protein